MSFENFLLGLTVCSVFTGIVTEAVKKMLNSLKKTYNSNILAAICSVIVAALTVICYAVFRKPEIDSTFILMGILLSIMSWLGAMVGYDKIIQTIQQIANNKK